uniref:Uncharacterized protein n=1 Tax=Chrysotila carterae TaxID=13221 RepID=A0A7S4BCY1_CHRCT
MPLGEHCRAARILQQQGWNQRCKQVVTQATRNRPFAQATRNVGLHSCYDAHTERNEIAGVCSALRLPTRTLASALWQHACLWTNSMEEYGSICAAPRQASLTKRMQHLTKIV